MTEPENRRCAVVTGSTRGIGRAVARELAAAGMNVVVNSSSERSLPAAEAVAAEIAEEFGVETLAVGANVAIEEEANALIAAAAEANEKLDAAEQELADAQEDIDNIEPPDWFVMDRTKNFGVVSFASDADRIDAIASFFPFIFFLVAALVALTTMTRMVEDCLLYTSDAADE